MTIDLCLRAVVFLVAVCLFPVAAVAQPSAIRLNELLAVNASYTNADGTITDLLELHNPTGSSVNLLDCSLSDSAANPRRYVFDSVIIPANGYLVMRCDSSTTNSTTTGFGLKSTTAGVYFFNTLANGGGLIDSVVYGLQLEDYSIGRFPPSPNWLLMTPTFGVTNVAAVMGPSAALRINEWMASPSSGEDWLEIYNGTNMPVALGGLYLTDTPANPTQARINDLSFIGPSSLSSAYLKFSASGTNVPADQLIFKLSASGEFIGLYKTNVVAGNDVVNGTNAARIDTVAFGAQSSGISQGRLPDGATNATNVVFFTNTVSPAAMNYRLMTNLVISEVLSHTDPPLEDAVEIQNIGTTTVNISGWWLSDSKSNPRRYRITNGPAIPPGGFRVIYEHQFNASSGTNAVVPFTFNSARGDDIVLSQIDGAGNLTGNQAREDIEASANGISFGHYRTSVPGDYKFVAMSRTTFGQDEPVTLAQFRTGTGLSNAYPKVGPVVINEIMFQPTNTTFGAPPILGENPEEEYIELQNIGSQPVPLFDVNYPTNRWRLQSGVSYVFTNAIMPANSYCLVVGFDPQTNAAALANFRSRFGVSNTVPIYGPWTGRLKNSGDAVELYRPDPVQLAPSPDAGFVPYIRVDKVNYLSLPQWPPGAAGTGRPLQRKNPILFGNDPINWDTTEQPTAGRANPSGITDTDGDGIPDSWETAFGRNPNSAADAVLDPDGDGLNNLQEYIAGTNPTNAASKLVISQVIPHIGTNIPLFIRFTAASNKTYTVEYRNSLSVLNWQKVSNVTAAVTNRVVDVGDPNAYKKADRYYRVITPASN